MRKLSFLALLLCVTAASARQISPQEAKAVANDFYNPSGLSFKANPIQASSGQNVPEAIALPYYVFNAGDGNGFVIISGDDRFNKILGYSDRGSFDAENLPPQLKAMLDTFADKSSKSTSFSSTHPSWKISNTTRAEEGVLLKTAEWNQWEPFNLKAPEFDDHRAPIGCVPLAMAIICKYHEYPSKAVEAYNHKWCSDGTPYSYDYGMLNIDYSLLKDSYPNDIELTDVEKNIISELTYACAAAANIQFSAFGSSAWVQDMAPMLREIFGFSENCQYISRMYFEDDEWNKILKDQIDNKMPVLYDGVGSDGHAFVIDGYDSGNLYHVNWGWGGMDNGYFSLDDLNGFQIRQGMLINLSPSENPALYSKKYSRMWVDGGVREAPVNGAGKSRGLRINTSNIEKDKEFRAKAGILYSPGEFHGEVAIGLLNENDEVLEVSESHRIDNELDESSSWYQLGKDYGYYSTRGWDSIIFSSEIKDSFKIAFVSKEDDENNWKLIPGTLDAPTMLPVKGNRESTVNLTFSFTGDKNKADISVQEGTFMIGDYCKLQIYIEDGIVALYKDGEVILHGTPYRPIDEYISLEEFTCDLNAHYKSKSELVEKSYNVQEPGSLSKMIADNDKEAIGSIIVSGNINSEDMGCIEQLPFLLNINLENAHFVENNNNLENFMPEFSLYGDNASFVPPFENIIFPKDLKGFHQLSACSWNVATLDIPASVERYDFACLRNSPIWSSLSFVNIRNPKPVSLDIRVLEPSDNDLIVFVPKGSKSLYSSHPEWSKFKDIREVSDEFPFVGEYVEEDNALYLILTDFAAVVGFKGKQESGQIKDYIEYKGKSYPVTTSVIRKLNAPANLIANTLPDFNWNKNSVKTLYLGDLNASSKNLDYYSLAYIPGAVSEKMQIAGAEEMFSYEIDKEKGLIKITPAIKDITLDEVIVNGSSLPIADDGIYTYMTRAASDSPEVTVNYTLFGKYKLTSTYEREFNSSLPASNIESGVVVIEAEDANIPVQIYDMEGKLVYSGRQEGINIPAGIYILLQGNKARKILIN